MSAFVLGGANSWKEGRQHSAFLRFLYIDMSLWHVVGTGSAEAEATSLAEPPTATSDSELLPLSILAARIRFFFAFSLRAEALQLPRDAERHGTCAAASRSWEAVGGFCAARERERESLQPQPPQLVLILLCTLARVRTVADLMEQDWWV